MVNTKAEELFFGYLTVTLDLSLTLTFKGISRSSSIFLMGLYTFDENSVTLRAFDLPSSRVEWVELPYLIFIGLVHLILPYCDSALLVLLFVYEINGNEF